MTLGKGPAVLPPAEIGAPAQEPEAASGLAHPEAALCFPERSLADWLWALAVFAAACVAYLPFLRIETYDGDEGILLQGAHRILHGQVLYRGLFSFYTPGSFYWLAVLFHFFGDSLLTGRLALLLEGGLMAALVYLLARRVAARWAALLAAYAAAVMTLPFDFHVLHNWDSTLLALLALYAAVWWLQRPHWFGAAAVGFFAALTCLDEQSKGAGLVLGLVLAAILLARRPEWRRRLLARSSGLAAGAAFLGPILATAAYFASQGALQTLISDVLWPLRHYGASNALPYGYWLAHTDVPKHGPWLVKAAAWVRFSPCLVLSLLPWFGAGVAAFLWLGRRPGRPGGVTRAYYALVSCVMAGLLLSILATRDDYTHILFLAPVFMLVLAWSVGRQSPGRVARLAAPVIVVYALLFFTLLGVQYWASAIWGYPKTMATEHGLLRVAVPDPLLRYLARVPPGPMFVYPYMPDYYYLAGRANPTRFAWLQYGLNTPSQFAAAGTELAASRPPVVLFDFGYARWEPRSFPNMPAAALARQYPIEGYIFRHYRHCTSFALYPFQIAVFLRRDLSCPSLASPDRAESAPAAHP